VQTAAKMNSEIHIIELR